MHGPKDLFKWILPKIIPGNPFCCFFLPKWKEWIKTALFCAWCLVSEHSLSNFQQGRRLGWCRNWMLVCFLHSNQSLECENCGKWTTTKLPTLLLENPLLSKFHPCSCWFEVKLKKGINCFFLLPKPPPVLLAAPQHDPSTTMSGSRCSVLWLESPRWTFIVAR